MEPDLHPIDVYAALRAGVPGYDFVSNAYGDDEGFSAGLSRVVAAVVGGIITVAGEGTVADLPRLTAYVFTATTVVEWNWAPTDGSTVIIRPRRELAGIEVDDAPSDISPRTGRLAYTLIYPWGRVALRERSGNPGPKDAFPGFLEEFGRS